MSIDLVAMKLALRHRLARRCARIMRWSVPDCAVWYPWFIEPMAMA